jgi:hypothetical protein
MMGIHRSFNFGARLPVQPDIQHLDPMLNGTDVLIAIDGGFNDQDA